MPPATNKLLHGANIGLFAVLFWINGELTPIKSDVAAIKANPCRCAPHQGHADGAESPTNHFAIYRP